MRKAFIVILVIGCVAVAVLVYMMLLTKLGTQKRIWALASLGTVQVG